MISDLLSTLETAKVRSIEAPGEAQEEWVSMIDMLSSKTLFPLTNSWWTAGNIPGKKIQTLTYVLGIDKYEAQCRDALRELKGFDIEYQKEAARDGPIVVAAAAS